MDQWKGLSPRYVSKVDYEATSEDEISFKASERFQLLWVSGYRWLVTKVDEDKKDLKKIGYVPAINLVKEKSVEEQPWYLDVDRNKAEELLMTDPNRVGSFVVRPSQGNILGYALSGVFCSPSTNLIMIKKGLYNVNELFAAEKMETIVRRVRMSMSLIPPNLTSLLSLKTGKVTRNPAEISHLPTEASGAGAVLLVRRDSGVIHFCIKWDQEHQFFIEDLKSFVCVHDLISYLREKWMVRDCLELKPYIKVAIKEDFWEKLWSDFAVTEQLSSSHFKGKWIAKNIPVHIQSIDKEMFELQDFMTGIEILKRLNHKNIIHLHAVCTTGDTVFTVTEFLEKGNLKKFLKGEEGPFLTVPQLMHIASQVVDGLAYLEVKRVAHFSLASCNVIVGNNLICKISNFGYARIIKNSGTYINIQGRQLLRWMPPELINYGELTAKTSVWSFGILLYEIFTLGQSPYKGITSSELFSKLEYGYRLPMPPLCSSDVYSLMLKCWNIKPKKRPAFQEIAERRIFQQLEQE